MQTAIPTMSETSIARMAAIEAEMRGCNQQIGLKTQHVLHGGMYCRTILLPEDKQIVSVLIKIPTTVIVSGDCFMRVEDGWRHLLGYNVLPASAVRKQQFYANADTHISMFFPSQAETVDEAEREFTDAFQDLLSRRIDAGEETIITGE